VTVGGLFSGIGGMELGLQRAGFKIKWFCEIEKFCRMVIRKHWPDALIFDDITSMFSAEDSLVRTSQTPADAPEYPGAVLDSGGTWCEPFAWYDRNTQSWRTWQRCLDGEWEPFLGTWPRAGMTRNGIAYRRRPLVPNTKEKESLLLPTLTVRGNYNRKGLSKTSGDGLVTALKDFRGGATPQRSIKMWKTSSRGLDLPSALRMDFPKTTGLINPFWAEGYMGFPEGWTELPTLETPSSLKSSNGSASE